MRQEGAGEKIAGAIARLHVRTIQAVKRVDAAGDYTEAGGYGGGT
jgi:hypothetical protein